MNDAQAIEGLWQTAQKDLLPFDGQHKWFGKRYARHFTQRGLDYRKWPCLWSQPARRRSVMSPANRSRHSCFGGKLLKLAHYIVRSRPAQRGGAPTSCRRFASILLASFRKLPIEGSARRRRSVRRR